jgi:dihydroxyacetone kinase
MKTLPQPWTAAMEATIFSGWIYDHLLPHATQIKVAHPLMLRAIAAAKKKNDQIDSSKIADCLRCDFLPESHMMPAEIRDRRRTLRYRHLLGRQMVQMKNRVSGPLMETGVEYNKQRLHKVSYFRELLSTNDEVHPSLRPLLTLSRETIERCQRTEYALVSSLQRDPVLADRIKRLRTVPGVGPITALTWALEIGNVSRFRTIKQAISMLSAAVIGGVFTSPSSDSVFAAIKAVAREPGALLVVKNYTGDRLNFGVATEMARAEGIPVEMVIVNDDVALKETRLAMGARGLAGTVFIHKLVGAAAAEGKSLADVAATGRAAVESMATMGVSFSAGTSPAIGRPSFELGEREMELGLGIHGEPGVKRAHLQTADELTETLLTEILKYGRFGAEKRVAVMVNNLGATTEMELAIVARHAMPFLESKGFTVERIYAGTFLSSLDMAGISISVLGVNDERLGWLDAATTAPAWPNVLKQRPGKPEAQVAVAGSKKVSSPTGHGAQSGGAERQSWLSRPLAGR